MYKAIQALFCLQNQTSRNAVLQSTAAADHPYCLQSGWPAAHQPYSQEKNESTRSCQFGVIVELHVKNDAFDSAWFLSMLSK